MPRFITWPDAFIIDCFERRCLFSVTVSGDTIRVYGTDVDDVIYVSMTIFADDTFGVAATLNNFSNSGRGVSRVRIFAGTGNDIIQVNFFDGQATVYGGSGNDQLSVFEGEGTIRAYGEDGDDVFVAGKASDTVYGGFGNDVLGGGSRGDYLDGGIGNDSLNGAAGYDILIGADGNDEISGDYGSAAVAGSGDFLE